MSYRYVEFTLLNLLFGSHHQALPTGIISFGAVRSASQRVM
jgi:hypothetical protein